MRVKKNVIDYLRSNILSKALHPYFTYPAPVFHIEFIRIKLHLKPA
jgi:hypothetical protein